LPLIIHGGAPRSALVIGFGTGVTAGALLQYPQLDRRICAELLPAVVEAGAMFHGNFDASQSRELKIRIRDGRQELMRSEEHYDVITLEPPPPSASGVVNLYSREFYKLAASRLQSKGLFAQWLPLATQNQEDTRSLVRSFVDVFPFATLWTTEFHEMLLIGSLAPIVLDADRISERFNQPSVEAALQEVGIASPAALLATWVMGKEGLEHYAHVALAVTDNRPLIEYSAWVRPNEITRTLPTLLTLGTESPLINNSSIPLEDIHKEREGLMTFYAAGLDAYRGDRQAWSRDIGEALRQERANPYYRWTVGPR
jgi:spermidine synthase